jgi:Sigma-70, region 4.
MAKFEYDVDYRKLYPNVTISDEVLAVLKESDQKRKYCEYDLKVEKSPRKNKNDSADKLTELVPSREDSLDRLMEIEKQFASGEDIEADVVKKIMIEKMMLCVEQLSSDEKSLIIALFFQQKSEVELAAELGINQSSISRRKDKVLAKLKKLVKI